MNTLNYLDLEQQIRAHAPGKAYGVHGYYISEEHGLLVCKDQTLAFTGRFALEVGYNCGQVNVLLFMLIQSMKKKPRFVEGRERKNIFPKHYFCIDETVQLDGTPLYPFVGAAHEVITEKALPRHLQPEITSPLGTYKENDESFILFIRKPEIHNEEALHYELVIRSLDTPHWVTCTINVHLPTYRGTVQNDCLPYTSKPISTQLMKFLKREGIITMVVHGHEDLYDDKTRIRAFRRVQEHYADAEAGLLHKAAYRAILH